MVEKKIIIKNKLGLHARAAVRFVNLANRFRSSVKIEKDGNEIDGKSILVFGLFSIRERLSHLDGHLEVVSEPGQGTLVTLVMPLRGDGERSKEEIT